MKYVKTLSLATVAAALMAFVGASSASATVLCDVEPSEGGSATKGTICPATHAYAEGTELHAVNTGSLRVETVFKSIECSVSTIKGETANEGAATETVNSKAAEAVFTLAGCNCAFKTLIAGSLEVHWLADSFNGTLTSIGTELTMSCSTIFGTVHCLYVTNRTDLGTLSGGNPATLSASAVIPVDSEHSDALCPEESKWTASYEVTGPKPLYVAAHT